MRSHTYTRTAAYQNYAPGPSTRRSSAMTSSLAKNSDGSARAVLTAGAKASMRRSLRLAMRAFVVKERLVWGKVGGWGLVDVCVCVCVCE
jgi:hypothetical protein